MSNLIAVDHDPDSAGFGFLIADSGDSSPGTVFINGEKIIVGITSATTDGTLELNTESVQFSSTVFAYGKGVHRNGDFRADGAVTIVIGQSTVFAG